MPCLYSTAQTTAFRLRSPVSVASPALLRGSLWRPRALLRAHRLGCTCRGRPAGARSAPATSTTKPPTRRTSPSRSLGAAQAATATPSTAAVKMFRNAWRRLRLHPHGAGGALPARLQRGGLDRAAPAPLQSWRLHPTAMTALRTRAFVSKWRYLYRRRCHALKGLPPATGNTSLRGQFNLAAGGEPPWRGAAVH